MTFFILSKQIIKNIFIKIEGKLPQIWYVLSYQYRTVWLRFGSRLIGSKAIVEKTRHKWFEFRLKHLCKTSAAENEILHIANFAKKKYLKYLSYFIYLPLFTKL